MINLIWLVRMQRWARRPPSRAMIFLVFGIIAFGLLLLAWESWFGWPEALTVDNPRRLRAPRLD